jgi:hypothetical protein
MLQRVFVDANVLLSRTTRDWLFLMRNKTQQMFQLHATIDVVTKIVRARRGLKPELDGNITRRLNDDLIENLDEIIADFDGSIAFHGSDAHDRHVHAAATAAASNFLLTSNGSDRPN